MRKRRIHTALLIVILAVAAFLRLGWPGITEFKYDEATMVRLALGLLDKGIWPTHGLTSSLILPHPPLTAYLVAIPLLFGRSPALAVLFFGALGVLAVWLTYVLSKKYFDERVGLLAAALFATAPWAIFYSRKIWSQNVPAITVVFFLALCGLVVARRRELVAWVLIALGALMGLHLGGAAFAIILLLVLVLYPRTWKTMFPPDEPFVRRFQWVAVGLAGFLVLMAPYIVEFTSGDTSLADVLDRAGEGVEQEPISTLPARFAARVATGHQFHALAGSKFEGYYDSLPLPNLNDSLDYAEVWLILAAMGYVVVKAVFLAVRGARSEDGVRGSPEGVVVTILALWIVVTIGMWTATRGEIQPHHFIQLLPAQYLSVGILLFDGVDCLGKRSPRLESASIGLIAVFVAALWTWQVTEYLGMLRFVSTEQLAGGHSTPAREIWRTAREARRLARASDMPIVVYTLGDNPEQEAGAAEFDALLGDFDLYLVEGEALDVVPAREFVRITTRSDGTYGLEVKPGHDPIDAAALTHLSNGVDFAGISLESLSGEIEPGGELPLMLRWVIRDVPEDERNYSFTVQLMTEDWGRWGQVDDHFLRMDYWHEGDMVLTFVRVPVSPDLPPGERYQLVVAMYTFQGDGQQGNVDILDAAGNPAGQLIVLPLE